MNKIYGLIKSEGICGFLKRVFCSVKRRIDIKLYFLRSVKWNEKKLDIQRNADYKKNILFSIIVPVYNTPAEYLTDILESCIMQTYPGWELCIADASDDRHSYVCDMISDKLRDLRIHYIKLKSNNGISDNTNEAVKMASGDYIALLDHDDMLHPSALYECMRVLEKQSADMIYTDELVFKDRINNILSLHLKPDFSPDSLRGNNYICHMSVFSRSLFEKTGLFRKEYDGSQDYDMILRLTENADNIVHIPKVLYFWRSHTGSVAGGISAKSYAADAGKRAIAAHLERIGRHALVECNDEFPTVYNISYDIPCDAGISVLIWGTKKNAVSYKKLMRFEADTNYDICDIYVGGNILDSDRDAIRSKYALYENMPDICTFFNVALKEAKGSYIVCMNGMAKILTKDWLEKLLMYALWKDTGAVGLKTLSSGEKILECGAYIKDAASEKTISLNRGLNRKNCGYMMRNMYAHNIDIPGTLCFMAERKKLIGALQYDYGYSDRYCMAMLCLKIKKMGYFNICNPLAEIIMRPDKRGDCL